MITSRKRLARPSLRSLLATRSGALMLASICALIAVGILLFAMSQYHHTVSGRQQQATVLVSTAEIQQGTSASVLASRSLYKVVPVLASQVAPDAVTNAGALVGKVAAAPILPGEQLTAADFVTPTGLGGVLSPTERAVAVTLDSAHSVGGLIRVGDRVDVYGSTSGDQLVGLLVPDAVVLKPPATGTNGGADTVVLNVSSALSPKLMWMADNGKVWLELRGINAQNPPATTTGRQQLYLGNQIATTPTYSASAGNHR